MMRAFALFAGLSVLAGCASVSGGGAAGSSVGEKARPSEPVFVAADIAGKAAADLDQLLGEPDLTRIEGNGEFRRYALANCALLVILYPDENGVKRAASLSAGALSSGEVKPDLDLCLARGKAAAD